jgi:hypothetical protein
MTASNARGRASTVFAIQADFAQLIIVAILLALGANVLAAGLAGILAPSRAGLVLPGLLLIVAGLAIAFWRIRPTINGVSDLEGVIFLAKNRQPVAVKRYRFSGALEDYVKGLITENKALGRIWNENDFFTWSEKIKDSEIFVTVSKSKDLAVEAIEYFALERLSTHLTDYFNQDDSVDQTRIVTLLRKDVPELFLQNRFLDLFSRPMEERELFGQHFSEDKPTSAEVVAAYSMGARFDRFDLTLPKGTKIVRKAHGDFRVETDRFTMKIKSDVSFSGAGISFDFFEKYMKRKYDELNTFNCSLQIEVSFKAWQLLSGRGWQYYRWIDSFLERLEKDFHFERFLEDISWEAALTASILQSKRNERV